MNSRKADPNLPYLTWQTCTECGTENEPMSCMCSACEVILPKEVPSEHGTWTCLNCDFVNADTCKICPVCNNTLYTTMKYKETSTSAQNPAKSCKTKVALKRMELMRELFTQTNHINIQCVIDGNCFEDEKFPANESSISPKEHMLRSLVKSWRRPDDIVVAESEKHVDWCLFDKPCCNDVIQGGLGDCWMLCGFSVIAERTELLDEIFLSKHYNPKGVYALQLCNQQGEWTNVIIDDRLPCAENGTLAFGRGKRKQLWVPLLEKAFAKLVGSYLSLEYESVARGLTMLTGSATTMFLTDYDIREVLGVEAVFNMIELALKDHLLVCCSTADNLTEEEFLAVGLHSEHSFIVLDVETVYFEKLIRLRNIWGKSYWTGRWSENSSSWNDILPGLMPIAGKGQTNQGIFWICADDFVKYFADIAICYHRKGWHEYKIKSQLPKSKDTVFYGFQIDVFEATTVDIHLNEDLRKDNRETEVLMTIHDQQKGIVASSPIAYCTDVVCVSKLLIPGSYKIYCFSRSKWEEERPVDYMLTCNSRLKINIEKMAYHPHMFSEVLFSFIKTVGEFVTRNDDAPFYVHILSKPYWWGKIIAVENLCDFPVHLECELLSADNISPSRENQTSDIIPSGHRQIVQIYTGKDSKSHYDIDVDVRSRAADERECKNNPKGDCNPKLTSQLYPLHRQFSVEITK